MIAKKIIAVIIIIIIIAIVVGVLAMFAVLHDYEHTKGRCGNCKYYDKTLRTCWPKFDTRFEGDRACDFFKQRDYEN